MNKNRKTGFTIVELLIVIVVIGILAAITMVTYTGVQNRAKTAAAQSDAKAIIDKVQIYYTEESNYPTATVLKAVPATSSAAITDDTLKGKIKEGETIPSPSDKDIYGYAMCTGNNGVKVTYWDYTKGEAATVSDGTGCN